MPNVEIHRGDIVLVDLSGAVGGEQQNDPKINARPCVVIQNDGGNRVSPLTVVAAIADARQHKGYPQQVLLTGVERGPLDKDSVALLGHLRTIDRDSRITKRLGALPPEAMKKIDDALKSSLGLS
jgi:mRNA interferase MazF